MAFDFGLRWIGVAVGQSITGTATGVTTLSARNGKVDVAALTALVAEWSPTRLIVGLPLNMDATESDMSAAARRFGAELERLTSLPVTMVDERLTTRYAADAKSASDSHAEAARLIAETFLNESTR